MAKLSFASRERSGHYANRLEAENEHQRLVNRLEFMRVQPAG